MKKEAAKPAGVEEYFSTLPAEVKEILTRVRNTVKEAAPGAEEVISYGMPAVKLNGIVVWYAAWKTHIGLYPHGTARIAKAFPGELEEYKMSKGAIQFPLDEPMPLDLISEIVKFRVRENLE